MLDVLVLGPIVARASDRALPLGGRKQRILLARLAISEGRPVLPDLLFEDLWGSSPPRDPTHALQAHVSRLRATLPIDVAAGSGGYFLPPGTTEVDATRFVGLAERGHTELAQGRAQAAATSLRAAEALWRGAAFADLPDVAGLHAPAARLEGQRLRALTDRIDADLECGAHTAVLAELEALVVQDPLRERWWAQLVLALHRDGRRGDALETYRRARAQIVAELGVEPGGQLARIHDEVLRDEVADPGAEGNPLPQEIARRVQSPFTGRRDELDELQSAWGRRRDRGPQLVALSGESGIGKTRLAAEFAAQCADGGARVLFGRCDESLAVPYQPFMEMLQAHVASSRPEDLPALLGRSPGPLAHLLPELSRILPDERTAARASDPETERYRTFEAVAGWLAEAATSTPLLLVLDDLQWADEATLLLLRHLIRSPQPIRALIVATHRDRQHPPDREGPAAFAGLLRESEQVSRLSLSGLSRAAIDDLLASELGAVVDGDPARSELVASLERASGGNPLFVVELARHTFDTSASGEPATGLPQGAREVVEQRVRRLPDSVRSLLSSASVIGRRFDPALVQAVCGLDDAEFDEMVGAASYTRLIEQAPGPRLGYVFSHDVVREALYEAIPPLRRAQLHRAVAGAIEQHHLADLPSHYNELANHFSLAAVVGPTTEAVQYLVLAGRAAAEQRAPAMAVEYYRRARDLSPGGTPPAQACDLLTELGIAEYQAGHAGYRDTLLRSAEIARADGDTTRLAAAAVANSRGWWSSTAQIDLERVAVLESALADGAGDDPVTRSRLLSGWAMETVRDPARRVDSVQSSLEALELARTCGDTLVLGRALADHFTVTYASFTDPHGCAKISAELVDVAHRSADPGLELMAAVGHAQATAMLGDVTASDLFLDRAERAALELNHHARLWMVQTWRAMRLALRGHLGEAEAVATSALELGIATEQPDAMTWFAGQLFTFRWLAGRLDELIDEIEQQVSDQAGGIHAWRAAHALALAEVGRLADAETILDEFLAEGLDDLPRDMLWLQGMAYLCGVCAAARRPDAAETLYQALAPYAGLLANNGTIDAGPVDFHLGAMAQLVGDRQVAEGHLAAAERTCRDIDAPLWLRRTRSVQSGTPLGRETGSSTFS